MQLARALSLALLASIASSSCALGAARGMQPRPMSLPARATLAPRARTSRTTAAAGGVRTALRRCTARCAEGLEPEAGAPQGVPQAETGWRAMLSKFVPDRALLAKHGWSIFISYGLVSNLNSGLLGSLSWATFRRANPTLSPLGFGTSQWTSLSISPKFLAIYAGYYATVGTLLRPARFALAVAMAPFFTRVVKTLRERFGLPQATAVGAVVFVTNFVFSSIAAAAVVKLACLTAGVTVFAARVPA
ncbi:hypothetical protein KFE25_003127 [Diacronema lutheri]|uniref:ADP,ATP carrier protein n=2 Tax=Diacronema lutheri TaxID=2081491 RepID=A0A8J5XAM4_DIALT|nr:hypothetical protein KFE25_003127 [Diacronema lutheri]